MKNTVIAILFILMIMLMLPQAEAKSTKWPSTYIECLWKLLDYLEQISLNTKQQADDIHAMREKLAK